VTVAVRFEGVSKQYRLGEIGTGTISRDLERAWSKLRGRPDPYQIVDRAVDPDSYVWAVQDISFDVRQGEVLGLIGRNGAGKSTLLKLLSRITIPTQGVIRLKGTIASLLEVGTGFHPELTGRENVFLNGAILGMSRQETRDCFDEIVEFSGCAKYIDTPIRRYSSGMIVRLGFSVAAHLRCDTLIVDEVLAVGDMEFQRKCIEKMKDVAAFGRTILVVSHNMTTMARLCDRCAILENGRLDFIGQTRLAIDHYMRQYSALPAIVDLTDHDHRSGSGRVRLQKFWVEDDSESPCSTCVSGHEASFVFQLCSIDETIDQVDIRFSIHDTNGDILTGVNSAMTGTAYSVDQRWKTIRCRVDHLPLPTGRYTVAVRLVSREEELDWPHGMIAAFDVIDGGVYGIEHRRSHRDSKFFVAAQWSEREMN